MSAGLFTDDRVLYALSIALDELTVKGEMTREERLFLLGGRLRYLNFHKEGAGFPKNPAQTWLPKSVWTRVCHLSTLSAFRGILQTFEEQSHAWRRYYESARPEAAALPGGLGVRLSTVEKALLLRALRPGAFSNHEVLCRLQLSSHFPSSPPPIPFPSMIPNQKTCSKTPWPLSSSRKGSVGLTLNATRHRLSPVPTELLPTFPCSFYCSRVKGTRRPQACRP